MYKLSRLLPSRVPCFHRALFLVNHQSTAIEVKSFSRNPKYNVTDSILSKVDRKLHLIKNHPLNIIKQRIEEYCNEYAKEKYKKTAENKSESFQLFDDLSPVVGVKECFDDLLVQETHVSRQSTDTYYLAPDKVLRTHTSAHQLTLMSKNIKMFLCSGDVYRRDEIDGSHYPVFHQMEGVKIFSENEFDGVASKEQQLKIVEKDLKEILTGLAEHLFGKVEMRWRNDFFPFTDPSFELEIFFQDKWLEVLGCGIIHPQVIKNAKLSENTVGWAFGLGLERLAMVLFEIPDIRLFWSEDERFLKQFQDGKISKFVPYSKFPPCYKDVSFWLPIAESQEFHSNNVYEVIRDIAGDLVESVILFDQFKHPKTQLISHAYRINYRHLDRSLTNTEVDEVQEQVRAQLVAQLGVTLR